MQTINMNIVVTILILIARMTMIIIRNIIVITTTIMIITIIMIIAIIVYTNICIYIYTYTIYRLLLRSKMVFTRMEISWPRRTAFVRRISGGRRSIANRMSMSRSLAVSVSEQNLLPYWANSHLC